MTSFPDSDEILQAYADQVEALTHFLHQHEALRANPKSRLYDLSAAQVQDRLANDRDELDGWALLALLASFEATMRTDFAQRLKKKSKDSIWIVFRELETDHPGRVRFDDILAAWATSGKVRPTLKGDVERLLKHRHRLAHGRYWTNKYGAQPSPFDASATLVDYAAALASECPDFPLL